MRILKLRLKNLNSLVGEWEIDFANPTFTSDCLFAITGPTGAGKTTLLDAICLALYGRTPRLDRVNKSSNEVMSRQTGECYAEVIFQNQKGKYLCRWDQQRSRKKVDGNLQNPKHEIAEADSGTVLEDKLRKVSERVEEVTGMDFDRFTRSMLLAQGGFAAFLQATPDERAPILEQITGTEIYSEISIAVHERKSEEKKKLDSIQTELLGMQPLISEEEQKQTSLYEEKKIKVASIGGDIEKKKEALNWLITIEKLNQELIIFTGQQEKLKSRIEIFQPEANRLDRAKQALELSAEYATLGTTRKMQHDEKSFVEKLKALFPTLEGEVKVVKEKELYLEKSLLQKKSEQKEGLQTIQKVRELDLKHKQKIEQVTEISDAITCLEELLKEGKNKKNRASKNFKKADAEFQILEGFLEKNAVYEQLVNDFSRIEERFESFGELIKKLEKHTRSISETEKLTKESHDAWAGVKASLEGFQKAFQEKQSKAKAFEEELKSKLQGKETNDWRKKLSNLRDRKAFLKQIISTLKSIAEIEEALESFVENEKTLKFKEEELTGLEVEKKNELIALEKELEHLETELMLLKRIKNLEDARHTLEDGKVCPLCGSLEHPFALGNVPQPDEANKVIREKKKALKQLNKSISEIASDKAKIDKEKEIKSQDHQDQAKQLKILRERLSDEFVLAQIDIFEGDDSLDITQNVLKEIEESGGTVEALVEEVEKIEKSLASAMKAVERAKDDLSHSEKQLQEFAFKKSSLERDLKRLQQEKESLKKQVDSYQKDTLELLQPYGIESLPIENLEAILKTLKEYRQQWQKSQKRKIELDKQLLQARGLKTQLADQITKLDIEIKDKQLACAEQTKEQNHLFEERQKLFQEKNPNEEEFKLSEAVEKAEKSVEDARKTSNTKHQEVLNQKSRIETLEQSIKNCLEVLKEQEKSFASLLENSKFQDEEDFKTACLGENERKVLEGQEKALLTEKTELESALKDRKTRLEIEKDKQLTEQSNDMLKLELAELTKILNELQQEIGSIRQKLEEDKKLRLKMEGCVKAMEAQKKECDRWDTLHVLIGSSDGKKYRNFAQGLTFEMMVAHANLQLQKMTDRYLLTRDHVQLLDLNVVDNYQGGEMRTTKNLSGGESFIVSLSLALGLSSMASKNVRVDSFFLDEGFGSLDEDALDTALDTLASLHQDGKLIGVISHVPTLKERISSQIQITPLTGGRSSVSGPGCSRMGEK